MIISGIRGKLAVVVLIVRETRSQWCSWLTSISTVSWFRGTRVKVCILHWILGVHAARDLLPVLCACDNLLGGEAACRNVWGGSCKLACILLCPIEKNPQQLAFWEGEAGDFGGGSPPHWMKPWVCVVFKVICVCVCVYMYVHASVHVSVNMYMCVWWFALFKNYGLLHKACT